MDESLELVERKEAWATYISLESPSACLLSTPEQQNVIRALSKDCPTPRTIGSNASFRQFFRNRVDFSVLKTYH